ncbi:MAG: hypothetical protein RJA22_2747 [Verrucomicrobiota bacterium]|jgi:tetratricopeptide (TPR) repeat protein
MALRLPDDPGAGTPADGGDDAELAALRRTLESGTPADRQWALARLVALRAEQALTDCLRAADAQAVLLATAGLWECWLSEAGPAARRRMDQGIGHLNAGELEAALEIFVELTRRHPGWAEAHNKRATVLYLLGNARLSLQACRVVVRLKPHHFGAWNGMALCAAQLERWADALAAARRALELQPSAQANLDLIALAEQKLREENP